MISLWFKLAVRKYLFVYPSSVYSYIYRKKMLHLKTIGDLLNVFLASSWR